MDAQKISFEGINLMLLTVSPNRAIGSVPRGGFRQSGAESSSLNVDLVYLVTSHGSETTPHRLIGDFMLAIQNKPVIELEGQHLQLSIDGMQLAALGAFWLSMGVPPQVSCLLSVKGLRLS